MEIHKRFVSQFKEEEDQLNNEPDMDGGEEQLKKKEAEEIKKLEKMVKKENEQFEDLTSTGAANAKQVHDKIVRTLETSKKVKKEYCKIQKEHGDIKKDIESSKATMDASIKKKNMLNMICDQFMNQNFGLYLKHE